MRWMRAIPSFDSCRIALASNSTFDSPARAASPAGSSRSLSSMRRMWPVSASMFASTNAAGLLISCATPAASIPIDASFSDCSRPISRSRSSVASRM